MPHLVVLVLDQVEHLSPVLESWQQAGITGITIHASTGLGRISTLRDDLPLMPSLRTLFESGELHHRTLWAVVDDDFDLDSLFDATEAITGPLHAPDTGIMFSVPIDKVRGLHRRVTAQ